MTYHIVFETRAKREFVKLARESQVMLSPVINDLSSAPRPHGVKKLQSKDGYRLRKGTFRILYTIDDKAKTVCIYRIGHRRTVYR
ncbi:MAG: type II toxin-antitoxin system RelE/ParE family toxin [Deltaproteobacteria bacterium]|nr:type II toxin-antitoxin system RelE/ParE family toxin [Deltaproteobacteria bacterium]